MSFTNGITVQGRGVLEKIYDNQKKSQYSVNHKTHLPTLILSYFENPLALPESLGRLNLLQTLN